ncbi:E3 ubiquitin-protein ligase RNF185-like [Drosophila hydei]|uniref:E3 ubiquitin-protein ligase RNF185-like n=1 Tax=Drosophila hydei TaxID=7224 RepID=A0A6J1L3K1_DROHY|nr:E3 ubiquitin-protein ligase RNF185-like [Drosophila hydei]XP_030081875.1 E3 ubiquitin-protein ligase RNF185-like [Drosophila hydei]
MLTPCTLRRCCPVCRSRLNITKVIPLYGRNSEVQAANGEMAPRPLPQRLEPSPSNGSLYFGFLLGFQTSLGYGSFPIETLASALNLNDEQALFLFFGLFCLGWLMF